MIHYALTTQNVPVLQNFSPEYLILEQLIGPGSNQSFIIVYVAVSYIVCRKTAFILLSIRKIS